MQDFREFVGFDVVQLFSALLQFLESLHYGFCHPAMRFSRAAHDRKLFAGRDALVPVVIVQADTEEGGRPFGPLLFLAHAVTVVGLAPLSSAISSSTAEQ